MEPSCPGCWEPPAGTVYITASGAQVAAIYHACRLPENHPLPWHESPAGHPWRYGPDGEVYMNSTATGTLGKVAEVFATVGVRAGC